MYDWIQTAPIKYENYSYHEKHNGFGIRATLPPKPTNPGQHKMKHSFSTDKTLNVHGHNLLTHPSSRVRSLADSKSRTSSHKSLQRLLVTQEDVYPKPKPVPKQRKNSLSSRQALDMVERDDTNNNTNYELFIKAKNINKQIGERLKQKMNEASDYENDGVENEYDNFKYMDQCYMDEANLYDNCTTTELYCKETYQEINETNGKKITLIISNTVN